MNAQECYDAVIKARNDQDQQAKDNIYAGIRKSVSQHKLYYIYDGKVAEELQAELEEAGFKITADGSCLTSISWDLA